MNQANLIVFSSTDPEAAPSDWVPVMPDRVPDPIKSPDTMAGLVQGHIARVEGGYIWYRVERVDGGIDARGQAERDVGADTFACRSEN